MKIPRYVTGTVICLLVMMGVSTVFMNQSIFLELSQSFGISLNRARLSFSVASLGYSVTFLLAGPVMDRVNLKKTALCCAMLLSGVVFATSFTTGFRSFLWCMFPMGMCAALIPASLFPYMATLAPAKDKGTYVGAIVAAATLGVIWGRFLSGVLTSFMGFRAAYQVIAFLLLFCSGLVAVCPGAPRQGPARHSRSIFKTYAKAYGQVFKARVMMLMVVGGTLFFGFLGMITFLTYRLNLSPFHFSSGQIGWISFAGLTALVAPFSGLISRRFSIEKIIISGLCLALISGLILGKALTLPWVVAGLLLLFLSVYICQPLVFMLVGQSVSSQYLASASSFYIFFCIGGGSLSSIVLAPVWTTLGWHALVAVCAVSMGCSLAVMLLGNFSSKYRISTRH
ncbi:MAG: MFS transporter [Desulfobacterales bacterium]|nr:MFS transporter [Desulfobacterales bacterium]